jgi:hypothetical protein
LGVSSEHAGGNGGADLVERSGGVIVKGIFR